MNKFYLLIIIVLFFGSIHAQNIVITDDDSYTANSSAMLDVKSITKGLLIPRLTSTQRTSIVSPAVGLVVFDTSVNGFYYWNGSAWTNLTSGIASGILGFTSPNQVYLTNNSYRFGVGTNNPFGKMEVKSDASIGLETPIFQVINNNGDTVFAVYQSGVRVNVQDDPGKASGSKGGFAVGGFSPSKGSFTNEFLRVTPDSVRVYIEDDPAKASGSKGGFAVGGFSPSKTTVVNYMDITPDNYFIGHESGLNTVPGQVVLEDIILF
jgi:trimeric autotransporter adhesin